MSYLTGYCCTSSLRTQGSPTLYTYLYLNAYFYTLFVLRWHLSLLRPHPATLIGEGSGGESSTTMRLPIRYPVLYGLPLDPPKPPTPSPPISLSHTPTHNLHASCPQKVEVESEFQIYFKTHHFCVWVFKLEEINDSSTTKNSTHDRHPCYNDTNNEDKVQLLQ